MSRTFLRGISSENYGLAEWRQHQLDAPRVRSAEVVVDDASVGHSGDSAQSRTWWRLGPGDDPFLTQTLQVHFVELPPRSSNRGHGHQNEAAFYILSGRGYEIHDDERYDWDTDDLVMVHTDSVHRHFNPYDEPALALVIKAKSAWMYLGLIQQGRGGPVDESRFGPRTDWSRLWTAGVQERRKVVRPADTRWETTPVGRVRELCSAAREDVRAFSVDVREQVVDAGSVPARRWQMADEVLYVVSGTGTSHQWEVAADIADRYYARIAHEPTRHPVGPGDLLYVPQNTVHQLVADGSEPLRVVAGRNRLFSRLGYDSVLHLDPSAGPDEHHVLE